MAPLKQRLSDPINKPSNETEGSDHTTSDKFTRVSPHKRGRSKLRCVICNGRIDGRALQ